MDVESAAARLQAFSAALDAAGESGAGVHGPAAARSDEGPPLRARRRGRGANCAAMPERWALRCLRNRWPKAISSPGRSSGNALADRLEWAERVRNYWQALDRLRAARPIEQLARELTRIAEESAHNSLELWQCWLRLRPSRWNPEQRKLLSEYVVAAADDRRRRPLRGRRGRKVFRRYYSLFPKVAKMLPCWAVTSLSARGRLPFEPAILRPGGDR